MPAPEKRPQVVIVGAGFGGLAAAQRLANRPVDVTIVDRRNHHLFQPLLYQVATAALSPADIAAPVRSILSRARNVRVLLDEVTGVDSEESAIQLASGASLDYDWLVLASGARHSYFGHDDWAVHAPGLKSIEDATAIRRNVLLALERAETETDPERRQALLTFVVIGAGPTGVEMAGAIVELARRSVSNDFRSITPHCSRVILVEAGERVLPAFPKALSEAARRSLEDLGVEVLTGSPVRDLGSGYVLCESRLIFAETVVWAAGVEASPAADWLGADQDTNGRIFVEPDLRVPNQERIFAIGDTANASGADKQALPAVAPVAKQQGVYVADVILGAARGSFAYRDYGNLATIGRSKAVIDWGELQLSGFPAWLIWSFAHIWFLIGFRSRIAVMISWLWSYLTYQRSARLITGEVPAHQPQTPITLERKCA
jgi:NADH:ubiquinone reductase (H+-translocating)